MPLYPWECIKRSLSKVFVAFKPVKYSHSLYNSCQRRLFFHLIDAFAICWINTHSNVAWIEKILPNLRFNCGIRSFVIGASALATSLWWSQPNLTCLRTLHTIVAARWISVASWSKDTSGICKHGIMTGLNYFPKAFPNFIRKETSWMPALQYILLCISGFVYSWLFIAWYQMRWHFTYSYGQIFYKTLLSQTVCYLC